MPSITNVLRLFVALAMAIIAVPLLLTSSASAVPDPNQVVVCKYSHTPVIGELAQTVNIVNTSSLEDEEPPFTGVFPYRFSDQHGSSVAVRFADTEENTGDLTKIINDVCPPFQAPVCPEGTDHEGEVIPPEETEESFCNDPDPVCPEGTDHEGEVIPADETEESFCNDPDVPPVCPDGTDNAGQEIPEGQTAEDFCTDDPDEPIIDPPLPPEPVVDPPVETPTLPNTGSSPYLTALGLMGALILAAGSTLFMRGRKVRVPKA